MKTKTGQDLKVWLVINKLTQADLSELLGVRVGTVNTYCNSTTLPKMVVLAVNGLGKTEI